MTVIIEITRPFNSKKWDTYTASTSGKVVLKKYPKLEEIPNIRAVLKNELALNARQQNGTESEIDFPRFDYYLNGNKFTDYTQFLTTLGSEKNRTFFKQHGNQSILLGLQELIMKCFARDGHMPLSGYNETKTKRHEFRVITDGISMQILITGQQLLVANEQVRGTIDYKVKVVSQAETTGRHIAIGLIALLALGGLGAYLHRSGHLLNLLSLSH